MKKDKQKERTQKIEQVLKNKQLKSITQMLTTLAALLIVIIGLQMIAKEIIAPVLAAIFLSILLKPVYSFFRKRNYSKGVSVFLMIATFFVLAASLTFFLTWSFGLLTESLSEYVGGFKESVNQTAEQVGIDSKTAESATRGISVDVVTRLLSIVISSLGSLVLYFIIIPILAVLILIQIDSIPKDVSDQMVKDNPGMKKASKFASSIMIYVVGRFKVNFLTGLIFSIALLIIGVDFPFVWGILTMILSYIPYLGIIIAGIPPTLLAFATMGLPGALLVIGSMTAINLFAENVLDPIIQGKGQKLSTAAVVIALIFWTWLFGALGAILAMPLTVLMKIIFAEYKETHWIASLMEGYYEKPKTKNGSPSWIKKAQNNLSRVLPPSK